LECTQEPVNLASLAIKNILRRKGIAGPALLGLGTLVIILLSLSGGLDRQVRDTVASLAGRLVVSHGDASATLAAGGGLLPPMLAGLPARSLFPASLRTAFLLVTLQEKLQPCFITFQGTGPGVQYFHSFRGQRIEPFGGPSSFGFPMRSRQSFLFQPAQMTVDGTRIAVAFAKTELGQTPDQFVAMGGLAAQ